MKMLGVVILVKLGVFWAFLDKYKSSGLLVNDFFVAISKVQVFLLKFVKIMSKIISMFLFKY